MIASTAHAACVAVEHFPESRMSAGRLKRMHVIDGKEVSTATWLASEREFEATGHTSYIRPVYRNDTFIGFAVYVGGEAVGRVFAEYKHAALLLMQIRAEQSER